MCVEDEAGGGIGDGSRIAGGWLNDAGCIRCIGVRDDAIIVASAKAVPGKWGPPSGLRERIRDCEQVPADGEVSRKRGL